MPAIMQTIKTKEALKKVTTCGTKSITVIVSEENVKIKALQKKIKEKTSDNHLWS